MEERKKGMAKQKGADFGRGGGRMRGETSESGRIFGAERAEKGFCAERFGRMEFKSSDIG